MTQVSRRKTYTMKEIKQKEKHSKSKELIQLE